MTPEEKKLLEETAKKLDEFISIYNRYNFPSEQVFIKDTVFKGTSSFSSINPTTSFGLTVTPAVRQSAISAPTGGAVVDSESRAAINSIRGVLSIFGFTL